LHAPQRPASHCPEQHVSAETQGWPSVVQAPDPLDCALLLALLTAPGLPADPPSSASVDPLAEEAVDELACAIDPPLAPPLACAIDPPLATTPLPSFAPPALHRFGPNKSEPGSAQPPASNPAPGTVHRRTTTNERHRMTSSLKALRIAEI
jgi:hypothetical protein